MINQLIDLFENSAYYLNWPDRLFTLLAQATQGSTQGRFQRMTQFHIPRVDKFPAARLTRQMVQDHLHRHGVRTFLYLYDAQYIYFSVRNSQADFARYLYNQETGTLRSTGSQWGAKRVPNGCQKKGGGRVRSRSNRRGFWS